MYRQSEKKLVKQQYLPYMSPHKNTSFRHNTDYTFTVISNEAV